MAIIHRLREAQSKPTMNWILENMENVENILAIHPPARDNDFILFYYVLLSVGVSPKGISARELLVGMSERKLPHFDSVTRMRRKLQDEHQHLRGKRWLERHQIAEQVQQLITN